MRKPGTISRCRDRGLPVLTRRSTFAVFPAQAVGMLAIEELVEQAAAGGGSGALPTQTKEDLRWGLHVGCVVQISQRGGKKQRSFALYCGRGRVIHAWSSSRRNFRVRVDALRMLERAGYSVAECSETMDSFYRELFGLAPVDPAQVVQRATSAVHAKTSLRISSLSLILFARYGDAVFDLRQSLKKALAGAVDNAVDHSGNALAAICDNDAGNAQPPLSPLDLPSPKTSYGNPKYGHTPALLPTEPGIKNFLGSLGEHVLTMWLMKSLGDFLREPRPANDWYGLVVPPLSTDAGTFVIVSVLSSSPLVDEDNPRSNLLDGLQHGDSHDDEVLPLHLRGLSPVAATKSVPVLPIDERVKREATKLMLLSIVSPEGALTTTPTAESPETAQETELEPSLEPELPSADSTSAETALETTVPATAPTVASPETVQEMEAEATSSASTSEVALVADAELLSPELVSAVTALETVSLEAASMTEVETMAPVPDQALVHPSMACNNEAEGEETG
ncbi:hypothetical protein BBJ28_00011873 [Nothophytophthora sp. Chile5]|nr:hypothetical protein BBJ28_00011873 [Nothophytophthora sp. Chile5]